jgi:hypothetical protein
MIEKYREMVLDAAETVLGFFVLIELYMETLRKKEGNGTRSLEKKEQNTYTYRLRRLKIIT